MKALILGTIAASQATPIIEFITADIRTEILNNKPTQTVVALADADILQAALLQTTLQTCCGFGLVFDDQNLH